MVQDDRNMESKDGALIRERARALATALPFFVGVEEFLASEEQEMGSDGARQTTFVRYKENDDNLLLSMVFGTDGHLILYSASNELHASPPPNKPPLTVDQLRDIAETFVRSEYPDFPAGFDGLEIHEYEDSVNFCYSQLASDIPLPDSGSRIEVSRAGFVHVFAFDGTKPEPALPQRIRTPEQALQLFAQRITLKLGIHFLHNQSYVQGDNRLHLVYMTEPYASLLSANLEEEPQSHESHSDQTNSGAEILPPELREGCAKALEAVRREQPELASFLVYAPEENVFPSEHDLWDAEAEQEDAKLSFRFAIRKDGLQVFKRELEAGITIHIHPVSGRLTFYLGSDIDGAELAALSSVPAFSEEEALLRLLASAHARPVWTRERNGTYHLSYRLEHRESGRLLRGIDAIDGWILTCGFF
ncbi:hypothetical protein B9G55_06705 [Saccharibacillus sp. O16]|nr:hypothetical protein B9G55_06705 [Saccharibacillus sp. O16]